MARLSRSSIHDWYSHPDRGGLKEQKVKISSERNPRKSHSMDGLPEYITVKEVTFVTNSGQTLTIRDTGQDASGNPVAEDDMDTPAFEELGFGREDDKPDTRTPEQKQRDSDIARGTAQEQAEKDWNVINGPSNVGNPAYVNHPAYEGRGRGSGISETHSQRISREAQQESAARAGRAEIATADARRAEADRDTARIGVDRERLDVERGRAGTDAARADAEIASRGAATQAERDRIALEREKLDQQKAEEARKGKIPGVIGTPTYKDENIAVINPQTGAIERAPNPLYDKIRSDAERKMEELRLAMQHNQMTLEQATAEYRLWYDKNVAVPLAQAKERRDQAAEQRAALTAEEQRRQFAAQNAAEGARIGQQGAQMMVNAETSLLPYRVGESFPGEFASAVNSLAKGGSLANNAAAGINFSADAFEFERPDFKRIAAEGTREALKNFTPYNPSSQQFATASYEGIPMPNPDVMSTAPALPQMIPTAPIIGSYAAGQVAPATPSNLVAPYQPGAVPYTAADPTKAVSDFSTQVNRLTRP